MLSYDFMVNAFLAGGIAAFTAGIVGFFLVLRGQAFAGHALSHVGFAGAAAAALIGASPLTGMLAATVAAGGAMGALGERLNGRDVAVGMVLALSLGLGLLLLQLNADYAGRATGVLFGNIFAVSRPIVLTLLAVGGASLLALAAIARPLLLATLQPEVAVARGVSPRLLGTLFLLIVAAAVAASTQVVGVLLVFALLVGPPATANNLTPSLPAGVLMSGLVAVAAAWAGLVLAYYTDWPTSFWIATVSALAYFASVAIRRVQSGVTR